ERFSGMAPGYRITRVNAMWDHKGNAAEGSKPTGMICVDGVLYLAVQNLSGLKKPPHSEKSQHGDDAAIIRSRDHGLTWTPSRAEITAPMFPGPEFGGPAFVNFGRNNAGARDGFVYAISSDQWDNGSHLTLGRVPAGRIMEAGAWEWVCDFAPPGAPRWTGSLAEAVPVFTRARSVGAPDLVWVAAANRYLLFVWHLNKDFSSEDGTNLYIYEAPEPWGPFTLVHEESPWEDRETTPYCPRLPLKWVEVRGDTLSGWLQFSGSWRENSAHYLSHVRKFTLKIHR
ncbi:MAG: DUF4185 domain-containing protein, partial [bacterium]